MPQTTLTVNGRDYEISCGDGEERHLAGLSGVINNHIKELVDQVGQVGEARLLLMTALVLADELDELRQEMTAGGGASQVEDLSQQVGRLRSDHDEQMGKFAQRVEKIAARLEKA